MSKFSTVWVFSDVASRLPEVIAGAALFGEKTAALVLGSQADVAAAFAAGADAVHHLGDKDASRIVEDYADTVAAVINAGPKPALLLMAGTRCGKALASLVGARLDAGVVTEVAEMTADGASVTAKHMVFGGLALGEEKIVSPVSIVVIGSGVFAAGSVPAKSGSAVIVDFVAPKTAVKCVERRAKQGSSVDLSQAKRIVAVGRGIAKEEDLKLAEELCAALQGEMGCSRPIAEAEKWMGRERYIGISGVMPKPEVYLTLGISGQIQHMVGVTGAQTIVAVNKDKNAPIFDFADYGIVGDLYKVLPALISGLKG